MRTKIFTLALLAVAPASGSGQINTAAASDTTNDKVGVSAAE